MDKKNSMLLANMMSSSGGGGVEFKTSIYSTGGAYILLPKKFTEVYGMRAKGSFRTFGSNGWRTICGYYHRESPYQPYPDGSGLIYNYYSSSNFYMSIKIGISGTIVSSQTANMNFDLTNKTTDTQLYTENVAIPLFASYGGGNYTSDSFNNMWNIENVVLYDNLENEIANLVPAIVNGESGMYDTIGQQFYGNANSVGSLVCE